LVGLSTIGTLAAVPQVHDDTQVMAHGTTTSNELQAANVRIKELQETAKVHVVEVTETRGKLASIEKDLITLKDARGADGAVQQQQLAACSADLVHTKTKLLELEHQLAASAATVSTLEKDKAATNEKMAELTKTLEAQVDAKMPVPQALSTPAAVAGVATASAISADSSAEIASLKRRMAELEEELAEAKGRLDSNKGVDALQQQVTALTRDVKCLVETGRELGEEGRKQREELRQAELVKRELADKVQMLEAELTRLREQKTSHSQQSESARSELESKYLESESRRQNLEVDLKLADAERSRLRQEVDRLSKEVNEERLNVNRLEHDLDHERLRSTGSFAGSPSRTRDSPSRADRDTQMRLRESEDRLALSEDRCRQLQDEIHDLKMRCVSELSQYADSNTHEVGSLRQDVSRLNSQLLGSERQRRDLEEQLGDLQNQQGGARNDRDWGQHDRYGSDRDVPVTEGTGCRVCQERNVRIRTLLKEKAECHAQVRQLSSEVVGLTEALEMVTKRAQEKDTRHTELQTKMEKIVRLAGLVDPLLALDARAGPMLVGARKKKLKAKGSSKGHRHPSPIYARGDRSLTPPRRADQQLARMEAWQDALSMQPPMSMQPQMSMGHMPRAKEAALPVVGASRQYGAQMSIGRPRPQSARARIEEWEQELPSSATMAQAADARLEYLPQRVNVQRPVSANASFDSASMAPYPPANPRRPAPVDVRGQNSTYSSARPSPAVTSGGDGLPAQQQGFVGNMRPFSYLVKCVKEGSVTAQTELRIVIEYCNSEHYSRRHDIGRYQQIFERVMSSLNEHLRGRHFTLSCNKESGNRNALDVEPRAGSFEVYVEWSDAKSGSVNAVVLFSKLETMRYPNPANVAARLRAVLNGGEDHSDMNLGESDA